MKIRKFEKHYYPDKDECLIIYLGLDVVSFPMGDDVHSSYDGELLVMRCENGESVEVHGVFLESMKVLVCEVDAEGIPVRLYNLIIDSV